MGHYTDNFEPGKKRSTAGRTEEEIKAFILSKIPGHRFPDGEERRKLIELNKRAWYSYTDRMNRLNKEAANVHEEYVHLHPGQAERNIDRQDIQQFDVEAENLHEQMTEALRVSADRNSPEFRKHQMSIYLRMERMYTQEPDLFSLDQSDEELVAHYGKIMTALSPAVQERSKFDELEKVMLANNELNEDEKRALASLRDHIDHLANLNTIFNNRYDMIMNPLYPYIGNDVRNMEKMGALFNNFDAFNIPAELQQLEEYEAGASAGQFICAAFSRDVIQQITRDAGEGAEIYSPKFGTTEADLEKNAVYDDNHINVYGQEYADEFYVRANADAPWICWYRTDSGKYESREADVERSEEITAAHQSAREMKTLRNSIWQLLRHQDENGYVFLGRDFDRLPDTHAAANEIAGRLSEAGSTGVFAQSSDGQHYYHFHLAVSGDGNNSYAVDEISAEAFRSAVRSEVERQADERFGDDPEAASVKRSYTDLVSAEKEGAARSLEVIQEKAEGFRDLLNRETHVLNSSDAYRRVQRSVNDFLDVSYALTPEEQKMMLRSISIQAQKYLDGKNELNRKNSYTARRMDAMTRIRDEVGSMLSAFDEMQEAGHEHQTHPETMDHDTRVSVMRSLRRSMHGQTFDADRYAELLAMESFSETADAGADERSAKKEEILASGAIRFMKEHLRGQIADAAELREIQAVTEEALHFAEDLDQAEDDRLLRGYESLFGENHRQFHTSKGDYNLDIRKEVLEHVRTLIAMRDIELDKEGKPVYGTENKNRMIYKKRNQAIHLVGREKLERMSELREILSGEERRTQDALAQSVFGMDYDGAKSVMEKFLVKNNTRSRTFVMLTAALMDKGLTIEEVLDPTARIDEKKALGEELRAEITKSPEELKAYQLALAQKVFRHAEELQDFQQVYYKKLDPDDRNSVMEYASKGKAIQDGVWDFVCQYGAEKEFKKDLGKVIDQKSMDEFERIIQKLDKAHKSETDKTRPILDMYTLNRLLHRGTEDHRTIADLNTGLMKLFGHTFIDPAFEQLDRVSMTTDETAMFRNSFEAMYKAAFHSLDGLTKAEKIEFLTDPELKSRISIEIDADPFKGGNYEAVGEQSMKSFSDMLIVKMKLADGKEHLLSAEVLRGQDPQGSEKEFLDRFAKEVRENVKRKTEAVDEVIASERRELRENLSEKFSEEKRLIEEHPDVFGEVRDSLHYHLSAIGNGQTVGEDDPYRFVLVGGQTADRLIREEAVRRDLDYGRLTGEEKELIFTGIGLAAMKNGMKVHIFRNDGYDERPQLGKTIVDREIKPPAGLAKMTGYPLESIFARSEISLKGPVKTEQVRQAFSAAENRTAIRQIRHMGDSLGFTDREAGEIMKNCEDFIRILTKDAVKTNVKPDSFKLSNDHTIEAASAILFIAYGLEEVQTKKGGKPRIQGGYLHEPPEGDEAALISEAAAAYNKLLSNSRKGKEAQNMAEYQLAVLINHAVHYMNEHADMNREKDLKSYVQGHAGELRAKYEILNELKFQNTHDGGVISEIMRDTPVCTGRDLAGIQMVRAADRMKKFVRGQEPLKNLQDIKSCMFESLYLEKDSDGGQKSFDQKDFVRESGRAAMFADHMQKLYDKKSLKPNSTQLMICTCENLGQIKDCRDHLEERISYSNKMAVQEAEKRRQEAQHAEVGKDIRHMDPAEIRGNGPAGPMPV